MALIKKIHAGNDVRSAVVLDLGDLKRQGDIIKSAARAEADRILAAARDQRDRSTAESVERGHREGFERGMREGHERGSAEGRDLARGEYAERLGAIEKAWSQQLEAFTAARERMLVEARLDIVRLAVRFAQIVTRKAVAADPAAAVSQLEAILAQLSSSTRLSVSVHPDDLEQLRAALPALSARLADAAHVELVADAALPRGSCIARTPRGAVIDASIETQLERLADAILHGPDEGSAAP